MDNHSSDFELIKKLCFRLLPIQILLALIGSVNGIISSLFATNFIGAEAMSAVGLYAPISLLFGAVNSLLTGGTQIICGKYMGKNHVSGMQSIFSLNMLISIFFSALCTAFLLLVGGLDLTEIFASDATVRSHFNQYLIGMSIGIVPTFIGQQLSGFLSLENKTRLTTAAGIAYIFTNLVLDYVFIALLGMEVLGLALATSIGLWVFTLVQASNYIGKRSTLKLRFIGIEWNDGLEMVKTGAPSALGLCYQSLRGIVVNTLIMSFVGSAGISALTVSNSFLCLFWAIPGGMLAVSRMLISVSVGEEDVQSLKNVMRVMFYRYLPLMLGIAVLLSVFATPLTRLYYQDASDPVYALTVWGFRILPYAMPLSLICMHFLCYAQVSGKKLLMHVLPLVDGFLGVAVFSAMLTPFIGMNGVYFANVINGVITTLIVLIYSFAVNRRIPKSISELMVIPKDFGAKATDRLDITVRDVNEVVKISESVQHFCLERGIDSRRSYLCALMVEEMAGNIVSHGFGKDKKKHSCDMRILCLGDEIVIRIKDDCIPFDPQERRDILDPEDITKNIGIRMVYSMAKSVEYQNILGLNALTIRI